MMPPQYLHVLVEERQRELRGLGAPFTMPGWTKPLRLRLSGALIRIGAAIALTDPPMSPAMSRAGGVTK